MQQDDSNFLNMVQAVLANLKKDKTYWAEEPEIVKEVGDIEAEYIAVNKTLNNISGLEPKGFTVAKHNLFEQILKDVLKLCVRMRAYARRNKDTTLMTLVDHSKNSLSSGMEKDTISRCTAIVTKAQSMLTALKPFKVTDAGLTAIQALITDYNIQIDGRTSVKTDKTTSVQDVPVEISSLRGRLTLLDDLIEGFMENEEMIARYNVSRNIIHLGVDKTAKNKATKPNTSKTA